MSTGVLTAGGGQPWENELVADLDRPGATLTVVRRCVDVADLLAVAATGQAAAVVVAADLRRLSSDAVVRLTSSGVAVVGVHAVGDPRSRTRLERMGVTVVVADDLGAAGLADAIRTAILQLSLDGPPNSAAVGDPRRSMTRMSSVDYGEADPPPPRPRGRVVAVWGPAGGPGRTTVAMNLAAEAAETGLPTLLIDADTYGGVLANAFGLLDESPGLAGACRLAAHGRLDLADLGGLCWQVGPLRLLTGIARADRWPEVRPSAVPMVLDVARSAAELVVVDCGFGVEADEELSYDTAAPRRNGATLAVLQSAETVLAVGAADPPGMERLVRGLSELVGALPDVDPRVVLNRQRGTAAGADEAGAAILRFTGRDVAAVLPEDRAATDAAWRLGLPLAQAAPKSALREAIRSLSLTVLPSSTPPNRVAAR